MFSRTTYSYIIIALVFLLILSYFKPIPIFKQGFTPGPGPVSYDMYMPNQNPFRNYYSREFYKGNYLGWKPSLPYHHLTPDYQSYYREMKPDCQEQPGQPWLEGNSVTSKN